MMGIWNAAVPLGAVAGAILGGVIAEKLGWRHAFGIMAIPGLLVAGMFFTLRDYKTVELVKTVSGAAETAKKVKMKAGDIARDLMRNASLITTFLGYIGNVFVTTALLTWLPTYFYNMMETPDMSKAAMKSSLIFLFAIIGAPLGGVITDLVRKKISNARMVVPAASTLITAVILFISTSLTTGDLQYNLLLGVGFFAPFFVAGAAAVTQDVVHPGLRSTAYGICIFVQNLLGASLGPIFVGAISDRWDLLTGLRFLPLFMLFGAAMFLIGAFFYNRDLGKVERLTLVAE
jgi:sugar phosphate permease